MIPFVDLKAQFARVEAGMRARIDRVLEHQRFILGPEVGELEVALAERVGCRFAVGVSSGTDALLAALMADGIGPGDAVFVPAFTFTATPETVLACGATPVFVDVNADDCNIDVDDLEARIRATEADGRLRPRAVLAVDLYGLPANYGRLQPICSSRGMLLLADAAQSFGARQGNRAVGTLAPMTATSFFPAKPLGCYGDGGAVFTDDAELAARLRSIRAHGQGEVKYDIARVGLNARLDTMQAAILLAKLEVFDDELAARERVAERYDAGLAGRVQLPARTQGDLSAWAQYTIQSGHRDAIAAALKGEGVPTAIYYPRPMHLQTAYVGYGAGPGSLPVSEGLCARVLSLPMHPYLEDETVDRICAVVRATVA